MFFKAKTERCDVGQSVGVDVLGLVISTWLDEIVLDDYIES